jgi:hypothetical protein
MTSWAPISADQLEALVSRELLRCSPEQRALFEAFRVPMRKESIDRHGAVETVYVVAQKGESVIYYEDVEEGFNLSLLGPRGEIAVQGFEQWELSHALSSWV